MKFKKILESVVVIKTRKTFIFALFLLNFFNKTM